MARHGFTSLRRGNRGATSIEYAMLASGVAMAIAALVTALGGNISSIFQRTDDVIGGVDGSTSGPSRDGLFSVIAHQTFAEGREGWGGNAIVRTLDQIGTGLSLSGESRRGAGLETVSRSFDIPAGTKRAEISFDMSFVDSWDENEQAMIYLNGAKIGTGTFWWRGDAPQVEFTPTAGITATSERTSSVQAGTWENAQRGTDHLHSVRIAVDNPGETLTLGFGTTLNQSQADESLMIGNVEVRVGQ